MKTIDIHGKPYVMVNERILHFNSEYPNGSINVDLVEMTERFIVKTTVIPDVENPNRKFENYAEEVIGSSQINNTSALENAVTSSVGRALSLLSIGIIDSIASAEEVANAIHQQGNSAPKAQSQANDFVCPKCEGGVWDNRKEDIDGTMINQKSKNGKNLPAFKCKDKECDFTSWKCEPSEAGVLIEKAPHKLVEDENYEEAEEVADSELPF